MIDKVHFGKRIACLRKNLGLSQAELAETIGVTSQAVSKWECGNAVPDIDLLLALSRIYHLNQRNAGGYRPDFETDRPKGRYGWHNLFWVKDRKRRKS